MKFLKFSKTFVNNINSLRKPQQKGSMFPALLLPAGKVEKESLILATSSLSVRSLTSVWTSSSRRTSVWRKRSSKTARQKNGTIQSSSTFCLSWFTLVSLLTYTISLWLASSSQLSLCSSSSCASLSRKRFGCRKRSKNIHTVQKRLRQLSCLGLFFVIL